MGGLSISIPSFNWNTYGYLLDAKGAGITDSLLHFFIDFAETIGQVLGLVALAYVIFKIILGQETNVVPVLVKIVLAVILIFNYEPFCKFAITSFDDFAQSVVHHKEYVSKAYQEWSENMKEGYEDAVNAVLGTSDGELTKERKAELHNNLGIGDPRKFSLFKFDLFLILFKLLLGLCQIVIAIVGKFRDVVLAFLLLIGRVCVIGLMWEMTEGLFKGWLMSFLNALTWTVWLAIIASFQVSAASGQLELLGSSSAFESIVDAIAVLGVSLFMYLQVFNLSRELFSGSFGAAASTMGTMFTTALLGRGLWEGAKLEAKHLSNQYGWMFRDALPYLSHILSDRIGKSGLTEMDPSVQPYQVNGDLPAPSSSPSPIHLGAEDRFALPGPVDNGSIFSGQMPVSGNSNLSDKNDPYTIDAEYKIHDTDSDTV